MFSTLQAKGVAIAACAGEHKMFCVLEFPGEVNAESAMRFVCKAPQINTYEQNNSSVGVHPIYEVCFFKAHKAVVLNLLGNAAHPRA